MRYAILNIDTNASLLTPKIKNMNDFLQSFLKVEWLYVLSKFVILDLRHVKHIIDEEVQDLLTTHFNIINVTLL